MLVTDIHLQEVKMLKFKRVSAKNYLSIGEVSIDLDNRGLVLIEGINDTNETFQSNGSGKSTLLSTVTYALYGTTPSGLKADAVINRQVKKNMSVILEFEKDGIPYRIERYRKHSKFKNTTKLFQGDTDLTQKSVADTDKKILDIFGIDYLTYANSIMYGQGNVEIFATATDKGKKQILENLADIGVYRYAQDVAKEKEKEANALVEELGRQHMTKVAEIETLKQVYSSALEQYANTERMIVARKQEYEEARLKYTEAEDMLTQMEQEVTPKIEQLTKELEACAVPEDSFAISEELREQQANLFKLNQAKTTTQQAINKAQVDLSNTEQATNCQLCGAPLDAEHRQKEMLRLQQEIQEKQAFITQLDSAIVAYSDLEQKAKEKQARVQQEVNEVVTKQRNIQSAINELNNRLRTAENAVALTRNNVTNLSGAIAHLEGIPKPEYDTEAEARIKAEMEDIAKRKELAEQEARQYHILAVEVFSNKGIRSEVLDLVTPFLNERANHYLSTLSGSDIEIRFSTQTENADGSLKDKFDLEVVNGSGGDTYQANSEGEKKRIDLAISFAIQDLVQSKANIAVNLGLYDECFDGLDSIGCENVIKILKERQKNISSIFVITHNDNLKPLFENVVTMQKTEGNSFLIENK